MMSEFTREATRLEQAAFAIQALTYGELLEMAASVRDILGDRVADNPDASSDAREFADVLHAWASAETDPQP